MKTIKLCWREIFDCQMLKIFTAGNGIETVNAYANACTNYKYFIFNGKIYETHQGYFDSVDVEIVPDKNLGYIFHQ